MCGIVGVITKGQYGPTKYQEDAFYDMLLVDVIRGDDATGTILVEKDSSFTIMKDQWQSYYVVPEIKDSAYGKKMFTQGKAFIGHNRKATVGKVDSKTAHPFVVDGVFAMVHNGTLRNHKKLADKEVDSEALAIHLKPHLGKDFNKEAFEEAIGKVEGAYAVVAYNQETNCVYLFRNSERPLAIIETDQAFFFGSEYGMVAWCAGRNNNNLKDSRGEFVSENTLYKIDLEKNTLTKEGYTPKKFMPVTKTTTTSKTGGNGFVGKSSKFDSNLSKNEFKRLKRKLLGTTIQFWADDFVEKEFPKRLDEGATVVNLMGTCDSVDFLVHEHFISGEFDAGTMSSKDLLDRLYSARIEEIAYNSATGCLSIFVDAIKVLPKSVGSYHETQTPVHTLH